MAKLLEFNFSDSSNFPEKTTRSLLTSYKSITEVNTDPLFSYEVFPKYILEFKSQWKEENRAMKIGDIIIQRIFMPPLGHGMCFEFAVKVKELFLEKNKVGFSYETLKGHPESGLSEFYFEQKENKVYFTIHTLSLPSLWIAKLTKNIFTLPYQNWCTDKAIENVVRNTKCRSS